MSAITAQTRAGWKSVELQEIGKIVTGSTPPKARQEYYGGSFPFVKPGELLHCPVSDSADHLSDAGVKVADVTPAGGVLVSCIGNLGKTGLAARPVAFNQQINAIIPHFPEHSKWVFYTVQTPDFASQLAAVSSATTIAIVNKGKFSALRIPFAPDSEQRRIVAEIEKQFTRLEAGVAALKRVQAGLKRYRAAVLKAACTGQLVPGEAELARNAEGRRQKEDKRSDGSTSSVLPLPSSVESGAQLLTRILTERRKNWQGRGRYKEPAAPDTAKLPQPPEGWTWATAQQLNLSNRPCAYGVLQPGEDIPGGVPFVRVGDINNGKVDSSNLKRISTTIANQYPRTKLRGGELAITLVGAIGRTAIIPDSLEGGNTARAVGIIPLTKQANAHWVEIWFRNPAKNAEMDAKSHEVARKTLNLEDVRVASVALPPLPEQTRIVAEVERRLSVVEELEAVVSVNLQRATRLRQSILAKAFSEKL
jgi:type I restriction enzyme, S subunit